MASVNRLDGIFSSKAAQGSKLLANAVAVQANVLAYEDGFTAAALGCLVLIALMQRGPRSIF